MIYYFAISEGMVVLHRSKRTGTSECHCLSFAYTRKEDQPIIGIHELGEELGRETVSKKVASENQHKSDYEQSTACPAKQVLQDVCTVRNHGTRDSLLLLLIRVAFVHIYTTMNAKSWRRKETECDCKSSSALESCDPVHLEPVMKKSKKWGQTL